jgi:pimeloyl-ACP methyl ester carboxylesterase
MVLAAQSYGEGPTVVLLPWFSLSHAAMAAACEPALARSGWRRLYLDLPGTGRSAPVEPRSDAVADAVAQTIDALAGPAPVALAGCSYGGYLAAALASRDPDRIRGLLLICSGVRIRPADRDLSGVLPSAPEPGWLDDVPDQLRGHFEVAVGHQTRAVADRMAAAFRLSGQSDERYLAELRATGYQLTGERSISLRPIATVLTGRRDRVAGFRDQFELAAAGRAADFVCLDDVGHYLPFEQPDRFAAAALDWLARCEAASPLH